jgi:hypothetical protein
VRSTETFEKSSRIPAAYPTHGGSWAAEAKFMMFSKRVHLVLDVEDGGATIRFKHTCGQSFEHYEGSWT